MLYSFQLFNTFPVQARTESGSLIRFGVFELDLRNRELRKKGVKVKLQQQPLDLLQILLERQPDVVTREELRGRLWPAGVHEARGFVQGDRRREGAVGLER